MIKIVSGKNWEAIQQEFMKVYAAGMSDCYFPQSFWFNSAKRMVDAGVLHIEVKATTPDQQQEDENV